MSDLYIMFEEAFDAPTAVETNKRLRAICDRWNLTMAQVRPAFMDYIDSDLFYINRGM